MTHGVVGDGELLSGEEGVLQDGDGGDVGGAGDDGQGVVPIQEECKLDVVHGAPPESEYHLPKNS